MLKKLKRLLISPLLWVIALVFLLEEYIWDTTARWMARLGAVAFVHAIEKHISALPTRWAFFAFLLPGSILIPAKLIGLHAIANGHWVIGSITFLLAKLVGMALFSRIFNLTRPALLRLPWFAKLYHWIMLYRDRIHQFLNHWQAYQSVKHTLATAVYLVKGKGRLLRYLRRVYRLKHS